MLFLCYIALHLVNVSLQDFICFMGIIILKDPFDPPIFAAGNTDEG